MKYVIFTNPEKPEGSLERHVVILISEYVTHATTERPIERMIHGMVRENDVQVHRQSKYSLPHSAGFFRVGVKDGTVSVTTHGYSESMELGPKPGDEELILAALQA